MKTTEIKENGFRSIYKGVAPFMKFENGFGYYGVLLEEEKTGKLQCHLCGKTSLNLAKHIFHKHKDISPDRYKEITGLNKTTPLMCESTRRKMKNNFLNLTNAKKKETIDRLRRLNSEHHKRSVKRYRSNKASLELNNRYGTCPEQVRSQFISRYNELGRIPNWKELSYKLRYIIEDRFQSYKEAVVVWGVPAEEYDRHISEARINAVEARREMDFFPKYTEAEVKKQYEDFFKIKGRMPTWGEVAQNGMAGRVPFKRVFGCSKSELENSLK